MRTFGVETIAKLAVIVSAISFGGCGGSDARAKAEASPDVDASTVPVAAVAAFKRDIPVVVVSIVAGENQGGIIGAVDVLQKPVIREDLLAALRRSIPLNKARILIVDDDADARHVLLAHLEDEAYECRQATNGKEALVAMEEFMPDLVFLDLMMPEMDGMTFLSHVRAEPRFQWMPVVVVTAKELTPEEAEQLRNTAHNVVKKGGVFEADLKRIMRRLLQRRQLPTAP